MFKKIYAVILVSMVLPLPILGKLLITTDGKIIPRGGGHLTHTIQIFAVPKNSQDKNLVLQTTKLIVRELMKIGYAANPNPDSTNTNKYWLTGSKKEGGATVVRARRTTIKIGNHNSVLRDVPDPLLDSLSSEIKSLKIIPLTVFSRLGKRIYSGSGYINSKPKLWNQVYLIKSENLESKNYKKIQEIVSGISFGIRKKQR